MIRKEILRLRYHFSRLLSGQYDIRLSFRPICHSDRNGVKRNGVEESQRTRNSKNKTV